MVVSLLVLLFFVVLCVIIMTAIIIVMLRMCWSRRSSYICVCGCYTYKHDYYNYDRFTNPSHGPHTTCDPMRMLFVSIPADWRQPQEDYDCTQRRIPKALDFVFLFCVCLLLSLFCCVVRFRFSICFVHGRSCFWIIYYMRIVIDGDV